MMSATLMQHLLSKPPLAKTKSVSKVRILQYWVTQLVASHEVQVPGCDGGRVCTITDN